MKGTRERIKRVNVKNQENLKQFRTLQNRIDELNLKSTAELQGAMQKALEIHRNWEDELYNHQRDLLMHVFDRVHHTLITHLSEKEVYVLCMTLVLDLCLFAV